MKSVLLQQLWGKEKQGTQSSERLWCWWSWYSEPWQLTGYLGSFACKGTSPSGKKRWYREFVIWEMDQPGTVHSIQCPCREGLGVRGCNRTSMFSVLWTVLRSVSRQGRKQVARLTVISGLNMSRYVLYMHMHLTASDTLVIALATEPQTASKHAFTEFIWIKIICQCRA